MFFVIELSLLHRYKKIWHSHIAKKQGNYRVVNVCGTASASFAGHSTYGCDAVGVCHWTKSLRDICTEKEKVCLNRLIFSRTYITETPDDSL